MPKMTKLDAVNRMLIAAGEQPVSSLVDDAVNDVTLAVTVLDQSLFEILQHGLGFNREVKLFHKDSNDNIIISDSILHVVPADKDQNRNLRVLGNFLYDVDDNTYLFTDDTDGIYLDVTTTMDFEDIPTAAQLWVADHAARVYQMQTQRSREVDAFLAEREAMSKAKAIAADLRNRQSNYNQNFRGNTGPATSRTRYGLRGFR